MPSRQEFMKLFWAYLRQRQKGIFVFFLFCVVFTASFLLYHLPVRALAYPTLFCLLSGSVLVIWDFSHARQKHRLLHDIQQFTAAMMDALPEPQGADDEDYQAIIRALQQEMAENTALAAAQYQDMLDYYTVWVHQIKTPITSMRLSLEQEDTALSRKLSSDLFQIEQYVEMVLAFLRLDADTSDYVFQSYALDEIIEQTVTKFAAEFIARKIRLHYTPTGETVVTDEKWLSFVIGQILSNALKYTREGEIQIAMRQPKTLCIADTGIGIAPSDLPRVFEKGYTGYNGRKDKRASGIGLYLCRQICDRLGVGIRIASEPDRGTTVLLHLEQYQLKNE